MMQLAQANWPILLVAVLVGLLVAWLIFRGTRKTTITRDTDAADADAPARRNQALIDAPSVAAGAVGGAAIAAKGAAMAAHERGSGETDIRPVEITSEPAAPTTLTPDSRGADDLTRIKGVGPKLAALLHDKGVTSFGQIASWDDAEIDRIDAELGRFQGRIRRDDWRKQAAYLASGDTSGYEDEFGKL